MSIPPLVCSTPPPPDQCEDDKDPDDFDLHYNLSQEDDDETYDYGSFTDYNQCQSSPSKSRQKPEEVFTAPVQGEIKTFDNKIQTNECESITKTFINTTGECKVEEEINIEDLNLNIDEDVIEKQDVTEDTAAEKQDELEILEASIKNDDDLSSTDSIEDPTYINRVIVEDDPCSSALPKRSDLFNLKNIIEPIQAETLDEVVENDPVDLIKNDKSLSQIITPSNNFGLDQIPKETAETGNKLDELEADDSDFREFDEFHCISGDGKSASVLQSCDNPWGSKDPTDDDFGDFKANFDNESNIVKPETDFIHSNIDHEPHLGDLPDSQVTKLENSNDDDDFCDFEEFQSSAGPNEQEELKEELPCQQVPFLNLRLQDNEDQFVDNVNKVLCEIFEHEMPVVELTELGVKLESFLGEMWGHLLEIDTRQPYMVNWNNSLGQKTLLKALGIDSRNILFGPKWNYNMPKYAANLSVAPLQPQKQTTTPTAVTQQENSNADKSGAKTGMWSDPFDTETQEFTYAEALLLDLEHLMATLDQMANNHSTVKISELLSHACNPDSGSEKPAVEAGPIDLDVFEAPTSTIPDKIYSSTINVQPMRQINLPDTHIFTPSDSETPKSKTIHYDNVSPVLLPQTVIDNKNTLQNLTPQPSTSGTTNEGTEYWDFQDFKSVPSSQVESKIDTSIATPIISEGTQVLEPIKVEPMMPTLNWPEPGEVKETFDDFSDFISNTTWNNEKQDISKSHIKTPKEKGEPTEETKITNAVVNSPMNEATFTKDIKNLDDEFDTFQSAFPPTASTGLNINCGIRDNINIGASTILPSQPAYNSTGFDNGFNINHKQNPTTFNNTDKVINTVEPTRVPIKSEQNILQPTVAKPQHTQQKSGQILQPLTLEGYSQINWPNPGIDLQDLSRFNPVETLQSLKTDLSTNSHSKMSSPVHNQKSVVNSHQSDDDWGEFVSIKPKPQQQPLPKKPTFQDDDEWTDFISSPNVKPQNGLNTISLNVHTNLNTQKASNQNTYSKKTNQTPLDIPSLNYVTPKSGPAKSYNERHFQNL